MARIENIIKDVETCIDEIGMNDAEMEGWQDDMEREIIIRSKIKDALRFINANADWSLLEPDVTATADTLWEAPGYPTMMTDKRLGEDWKVGMAVLPENFLRLVYVQMDSWVRPLGQQDIIFWNDKEYAILKDIYCTGTSERPKVALVYKAVSQGQPDTDGNAKVMKVLELYSAEDAEEKYMIGIMTEPEDVDGETSEVSVGEKVYGAFIYYIAGLVFVTYGDQARSKMMFDQANDIIGFTQQTAVSRRTPAVADNEETA